MTVLSIATELGVSRGYIHDVEHARRAPLSPEQIARVAACLDMDAAPLLEAAALDRGYVRIAVSSAEQARAALAFAAGVVSEPASSDGW